MSLDILNNKGSSDLSMSKLLSEENIQNGLFEQSLFNNKKNTFEEISAFKNSPFGQYWEKQLPSWAIADYGPARILNESSFSIIDLSKKFNYSASALYNKTISEDWEDIKFKVYANPDGQEVLKQYANPEVKPNNNEIIFFIETDDGKFDFGKIVRVKLGAEAIKKLHFQYPFFGQTDEEELAEEFLKRPFEVKNNPNLEFVQASKEVKLDTKELKDLLVKAIKYDFNQKKFDDMSWFLLFLQGDKYLGLNIPKKILEFSHWMRTKKYEEEKYWNALLNKGFTPAFLPNSIVPQNRKEIQESIKNKFKQQIDSISKFNQNDAVVEKIFKEILNNVLLYLFEKFSSLLDDGLKKFDELLPEGEMLNEIYNLNAFLVGLWNGCLEFVAGLIDLVSLVMIIARDGIGFVLTDALGEAFENLLNELVFNFEDFIKKLWTKLVIALKEFPDWYLKYGTNQYYWYKKLGELTPDILFILVPALKAGRAAKAAEEASILKKAATSAEKDLVAEREYQKYLDGYYEALRNQSDDFSRKLEEQSAKKESKEAFEKAAQKLDEEIPDSKVKQANFQSSKKIMNQQTGKEFGEFLFGKYLKLTGSKTQVFGGNTIVLVENKTTTVTGILDDVNSIARRGEALKGVTKMGENKGGINILRSPKWSEILEKYKNLEAIDKNTYYKKVTDEFWETANRPWLDESIKRGDPIRFVTDPNSEIGKYVRLGKNKFAIDKTGNKIPTIFSREVEYLKKNGYKIDGHIATMIK
ncbi:hypothetical protein [Chryseobacterium viscerum]|uniref:Uncharacterized protein n=1 Tax=Chryseobacterium viscerum TaxID=1037377 RepID=A0A5N4BUB3_9FLAO|nr:hypothetical protein [Chryseobacterium viscerum]KAB1231992.1 hypothetical protein F8D52_04980 [Chryseobacterium viscerum]